MPVPKIGSIKLRYRILGFGAVLFQMLPSRGHGFRNKIINRAALF